MGIIWHSVGDSGNNFENAKILYSYLAWAGDPWKFSSFSDFDTVTNATQFNIRYPLSVNN